MRAIDLINSAMCYLFGHTRGKRVEPMRPGFNRFKCRTCSATWERKARAGK